MTRVSRLRSLLALPFPLGAGFGGLTISLEGGLDEVDEFFFARASSASSFSRRTVSSAIFFSSSAHRGQPPGWGSSMMRTSYRLTPNQPRAVLAAVNGYLIRLPITTWPGWVIALWTAAAVAVGYSAPSLTRLAAEGQGKLLGKDAESQLAADGLSLAWPDQAYESLAVAAFYRADGLTANDIGCAKRLARRIEGGDHPAAVLRVLGPDSAPDIANRLFSGDGTVVLVATALSTSFVAPATHEAVAWLQSQVRADQLDVPDGLVVRGWVMLSLGATI